MITGRRNEGALDEEATAFLSGYLALPPELRESVERLMADRAGYVEQGPKQVSEN